ncbi:MAG: hypothetical protein ACFFE6_05640 [Candidatus Thorarchaeota archaeon]
MKPKIDEVKICCLPKLVGILDVRTIIGLVMVLLIASPFTLFANRPSIVLGDIDIESSYYQAGSVEVPTLSLTYTTRTLLTDTPVVSGAKLSGDHVKLKAVWTPAMNKSRLEVHAPAIPSTLSAEENETSLEIDTRALGNNATCTIIASTWLSNGTMISEEFVNVYIGNFFMPKVTVLDPNGGENWTSHHDIIWYAYDTNTDDILLFDVLFSDDSGASFSLLASSINQTWFEWDCANLPKMDTYVIEVRVTDGIYFTSDRSDSVFSAGLISTTPTTTTTTTTTIGPNEIETRILAFMAILLVSSGVMALIVYYAARKWF